MVELEDETEVTVPERISLVDRKIIDPLAVEMDFADAGGIE